MYSGLSVTVIRDAPFSGLYLLFFTQGNKFLHNRKSYIILASLNFIIWQLYLTYAFILFYIIVKTDIPQAGITFTSGVIAGILASLVTHPPDVVKTKLQIDPKSYRNTIPTIVSIYKSNGIQGFYRGLILRLTRRTLMAAMAWTVYEQVVHY